MPHVWDSVWDTLTGRNQGAYGESKHTDRNPIHLTANAPQGPDMSVPARWVPVPAGKHEVWTTTERARDPRPMDTFVR